MKILINSYPNSGAWTLADMCIRITKDSQTNNYHHMPEGSDWIIWKHEAIMLIADFGNDVTQYFILRDPIESIAHNVDRWFSGHVGRVIEGKSIVKESQIKTNNELSIREKEFIDNQIMIYMSYLNCLDLNNKNVLLLYSEMEEKPLDIAMRILKNSGVSNEKMKYSNIHNKLEEHIKTQAYQSVVDYIYSHKDIKSVYKKYNYFIDQKSSSSFLQPSHSKMS
jgi:hypothetical protein